MKEERKALRAKRVGIAGALVFAMLISTCCVISPTTVVGQDIGGEFGGDFRIGLKEEPNTFNPLDASVNDAAMQIIDLVYDSLGRALGPQFRINQTTLDKQFLPGVAIDEAGDFVAVWKDIEKGDDYATLFCRKYSRQGEPLTDEVEVAGIWAESIWEVRRAHL